MSVRGLYPSLSGQRGNVRNGLRLYASKRKASVLTAAIILALAILVPLVHLSSDSPEESSAEIETQAVIPMLAVIYQHKDTVMPCVAIPPCAPGVHAWNDTSGPDTIYGNGDDCPHCSCYCAPASIAMISTVYGMAVPFIDQDQIYDNGKLVPPEITGSGVIETHGVGMYDGTGGTPIEVQGAMIWSLMGMGILQHDLSITMNPLTPAQLQTYISSWQPVLWLDHGGWPSNQSSAYPPSDARNEQGHAKVIGGYDDNGTANTTSDDLCLIFDPWPEYTDKGILPKNATQYAGGVFDPYWLPLSDVNLTDVSDIFLVPVQGIPEFSDILVPVLGAVLVAVASMRFIGRRDSNSGKCS